jgi:hypothetical protein
MDNDGLADFLVYRPRPDARRGLRILRTDRGYRVLGRARSRDEVEAALAAAGIREGETVEVEGEELTWER